MYARLLGIRASVLLATGCAALAACGSDAPSATPPALTTTAVDAEGTPPAAVDAPVASEERAVSWESAAVDWKLLAYDAADCLTRDQYSDPASGVSADGWDAATVQEHVADVTGDGVDDVIVQLTCPVPTSSRGETFVVVSGTPATPQVIGVLADGPSFRGATVTPGSETVTLTGPSVAADDPLCCAGHQSAITYRWTGTSFQVDSQYEIRTSQPISTEPLADGEHVAAVAAVSGGAILVDVLQWFDDPTARETACAEDGIEDGCPAQYHRNVNDLVRTVPVAPGAQLSVLDWRTMQPRPITTELDVLAHEVGTTGSGARIVRLQVAQGAITRVTEFFVS